MLTFVSSYHRLVYIHMCVNGKCIYTLYTVPGEPVVLQAVESSDVELADFCVGFHIMCLLVAGQLLTLEV